jgi:hypothetical protein
MNTAPQVKTINEYFEPAKKMDIPDMYRVLTSRLSLSIQCPKVLSIDFNEDKSKVMVTFST